MNDTGIMIELLAIVLAIVGLNIAVCAGLLEIAKAIRETK